MVASSKVVEMIDVRGGELQIVFSADKTRCWINIDGICRLRIYGIEKLDMDRRFKDIAETG